MKALLNFVRTRLDSIENMQDRIFRIVLAAGTGLALVQTITGIIQKLPPKSMIATASGLLYWVVLYYASVHWPQKQSVLRKVLVIGFNFIFIPILFFTSGGIKSGMLFFFMIGLLLDALLIRGNAGGIIFILSMITFESCVIVSHYYPSLLPHITPQQHYEDVCMVLLLTGIAVYSLTMMIFVAYHRERRSNRELMFKLQELSARDALSGLYNRRELFRRLNVMYSGEPEERRQKLTCTDRYIAMFDVDDFKKINDTYGHSFGDTVLTRLAMTIQDVISPQDGEMAARYGGEEFVCIIAADDPEQAYRRVNDIRNNIENLQWEEHPNFKVTISGGLISCEEEPDVTRALHDVDDLLYKAKAEGKNKILA